MSDLAPPPQIHFQDSIRLIQPESEKARVLLFHGLTGTPSEMEGLAKALFSIGCSVVAPLIPGHGRSLLELKRTPLWAWRQCASDELSKLLKEKGEDVPVFVGGLSMGSLLAIDLVCANPSVVNGLVLLSPPLVFRSKKDAALLGVFSCLPDSFLNSLGTRKKRARPYGYLAQAHNSFPEHSTGALVRLLRLKRVVISDISKISCPTLILYDPNDHHLKLSGVQRFFSGVPSEKLRVKEYPGGQHELTLGHNHQDVINDIREFIRLHLGDRGQFS